MDNLTGALKLLGESNPDLAKALSDAAIAQSRGPLDSRTLQLIYLGVLGALGAEGSFRLHYGQALEAGISRAEVIHAVLSTFTAVGITPLLKVLAILAEDE